MIFIDILLTSTSLFGLYTKFSQTLNVSVLSTLQPQLQMSDFLQYAFHAEAEFGLAKISGAILDLALPVVFVLEEMGTNSLWYVKNMALQEIVNG